MSRENYNGINLLLQKDEEELFVKASAGRKELGHVLFAITGEYLLPQDLEVESRYRGQGIAQTMYDYVKSKGYNIRRSGQQTDAGAAFWDKHQGQGQNIWL
jgi:predicted GNAT family acetyltransferase